MKRAHLPALLIACFAYGYFVVPSHASVQAPPTSPCNFTHRMDIHITHDGTWWECKCHALIRGWDCAWHEVPNGSAIRKHRRLIPVLVIRFAP
jgi:hypothetical protein